MARTLVIGDIHGAARALTQVLERCNFDYDEDTLICLGDVVDGWDESKEVIDTLLKVKNLIYILGNHDEWFRDWLLSPNPSLADRAWVTQGGRATLMSYGGSRENVPQSHVDFICSGLDYYIDDKNRLFVHGGIPADANNSYERSVLEIRGHQLRWDRDLWCHGVFVAHTDGKDRVTRYDEVFLGHTQTYYKGRGAVPQQMCEVWNLDQGAGWDGKLSIMDVDTKDFWQSDFVPSLYPESRGRRG